MHIAQIEKNLAPFEQEITPESFVYDLLLAYGTPKTTVTLLKKGNRNLSKKEGQIILKKKLVFQEVQGGDLHDIIDTLKSDETTYRHDPRFIVVTDYETILAIDTKTEDTLDVAIKDLYKNPFFFGPWAKIEKTSHANENPADVKAAEKMAKIYDEILKDNKFKDPKDLHALNIFLSRLLFCFFAEDTGIFQDENQFTNSISSHTQEDGSDLDQHLNKLFEVLNTEDRSNHPEYLKDFPYVNGGLFGDKYFAPKFTRKSRHLIIECGKLQWQDINPDIFGSMIQAVVHVDQRSGMGMHYTSVPNIMKVIEPLFLNELREDFEKHFDNQKKLEQILQRLEKMRIFDPACGSGNFLIIAYKEMRELEMEIFERIQELSDAPTLPFSRISLSQFYGIELDDFAHEVAILSLWLTEHQMNVKFKEIFGQANPTLPLKEGGNVVCGNATRIKWEGVCPKDTDSEIYILGNPPYKGARKQEDFEKEDMMIVFRTFQKYKDLDYISCWFYLASQYIQHNVKSAYAFVTTNSICQGQQTSLLWPPLLQMGLEIDFAYQSFKWTNNAKGNAGVTCVIVGVRNNSNRQKIIFANNIQTNVEGINPYLTAGSNVVTLQRKKTLSKLPTMNFGNMPNDGGGLILSTEEKNKFLLKNSKAKKFIKLLLGSQEYIRGEQRWCLWIEEDDLAEAKTFDFIRERIELTCQHRIKSKDKGTNKLAKRSYQFRDTNTSKTSSIIIPSVSSERREYIPMGFLDNDIIISNSAQAIYDADPWVFGIVSSKIHMIWVNAVGGKLETRIRYSAELCYNTFPVPDLSVKQRESIATHVYNVLEVRENHSEKTMAELYDPDKMPEGLREAHHNLDLAVERCYRTKPFTSDEERLEYLFKLYEEMINREEGKLL